jgi:uncharacterized protein RhaS with RHS repeats
MKTQHFNLFRYYTPHEGIYTQQDPIGLNGGMVLYGYVSDRNTWVDLIGLMPWKNPVKTSHHLVYAGKAKSIGLYHLASYKTTPTFFFDEPIIADAHEEFMLNKNLMWV